MYIQSFIQEPEGIMPQIEGLKKSKLPACKWEGEKKEYVLVVSSGKGVLVTLPGEDKESTDLNCLARICPALLFTCDIDEILTMITRELIDSWEKIKKAIRARQKNLGSFSEREKVNGQDLAKLYYWMSRKYREADGNIRILEEFPEGLKN